MQQGNQITNVTERCNYEEREKHDIDIDFLCYKVFETTTDGKNLMRWLVNKYVMDSNPSIETGVKSSSPDFISYREGFRDTIRKLLEHAKKYQLKLLMEAK